MHLLKGNEMITIFTIPKPFVGENIINQVNAVQSWINVVKNAQIILWGDDKGVEEYSKILNVDYGGAVPRNGFNTPLISTVFEKTKEIAKYDFLIYINTDIILIDDFNKIAFNYLKLYEKSIICGRRIDLALNRKLNFNIDWIADLKTEVTHKGLMHNNSGIDYILYKKDLNIKLKQFAVGRPGWDNWLLYYAKKNNIKVLDASQIVTAIHQNHKPAYSYNDKETRENQKMLTNYLEVANIYHADYVLNSQGIVKPNIFRIILSFLSIHVPFNYLLGLRRWIKNSFTK